MGDLPVGINPSPQTGSEVDEFVVGRLAALHPDRALLHCYPGFSVVAAHIKARAGDRDLADTCLDHKGSMAVVFDTEHGLALDQFDTTTVVFKMHLDPTAAVQIDQRAIRQAHLAALTGGRGKLRGVATRLIQATEQANANRQCQHTGGHGITHQRAAFGPHGRGLAQCLQPCLGQQVSGAPQGLQQLEFVAVLRVLIQPGVEAVLIVIAKRCILQAREPQRRLVANRRSPARAITSIHHGRSCLAVAGTRRPIIGRHRPGGHVNAAGCGSYTFPPCF
ncbi:hypothetical protein D3C78_896400 [compost metagenome]